MKNPSLVLSLLLCLVGGAWAQPAAPAAAPAAPMPALPAAGGVLPPGDPGTAAAGLPAPNFFAAELQGVLADPAWAQLQPRDQITGIQQRISQNSKSDQVPLLRYTIAYLYDYRVPNSTSEAIDQYKQLAPFMGRSKYYGQASLRAADLLLQQAKADETQRREYLKKAQRELEHLNSGIQRAGDAAATTLPLWRLDQQGRWQPVEDTYGYVLERIDDLAHGSWTYKLIGAVIGLLGGEQNKPWSYVLGLILLAVLMKVLTYPLTARSYKSMAAMQRLQPQLQELQKKHKDNPAKLNEEMMRLYKENGANPLGGCLPMLIQIPIFIAVYAGIRGYTHHFHNVEFLWVESLARPDTPLLIAYGISMFFSQKLMMSRQPPPADPQQAQTQKMMSVVMPVMFTYMMLIWKLPSAFYLYWLAFNIVSTAEQMLTHRQMTPGLTGSPVPETTLTVLEGAHTARPEKSAHAAVAKPSAKSAGAGGKPRSGGSNVTNKRKKK